MPWGKVDDGFYDHLKVRQLSPRLGRPVARLSDRQTRELLRLAAIGLHWKAISWSNRHLQDGIIPHEIAEDLARDPELAAALTAGLESAGLWEADDQGTHLIHDYLVHNKSRDEVLREREQRRQAGRLGGLARSRAASEPLSEPPSEPPQRGGSEPPGHTPSRPPSKPPSTALDDPPSSVPSTPASSMSELPSRPVRFPKERDSSQGLERPGRALTTRAPARGLGAALAPVLTNGEDREARIARARAKLGDPAASPRVRELAIAELNRLGASLEPDEPLDFGADA